MLLRCAPCHRRRCRRGAPSVHPFVVSATGVFHAAVRASSGYHGGHALHRCDTDRQSGRLLTPRAIETLRRVALIVAEDTRHSAPLLAWAGISTPVRSYHAHNEAEQAPRLVERLLEGSDVALISDAGTPLVSDPGARLVEAAIAAGVTVTPIPGASAILAALVGAGLPATAFTFLGFLPRARNERAGGGDGGAGPPAYGDPLRGAAEGGRPPRHAR